MEKKLVNQSFWYALGILLASLSQFYIIAYLTQKNGFYEAGIFSLSVTVSGVFQELSFFNVKPFQIVDGYKKFKEERYVLLRVITILMSSICCLIFLLFMQYERILLLSIAIYFVYRQVLIFLDVYTTRIQIFNRMDLIGKASILEIIASIGGFMIGQIILKDFLKSIILMGGLSILVSSFTCAICYKKATGENLKIRLGVKERGTKDVLSLLRNTIPLMGYSSILVLVNSIPRIFLQDIFGSYEVGVFSSLTTPAVLISTISVSLFAPYIKYFTDLFEKKEMKRIKTGICIIVGLFLCGGIVGTIAYYTMGESLFVLVYGTDILLYYPLFKGLIYAYLLVGMNTILMYFYVIIGKRSHAFLISVIFLLLSAPFIYYCIEVNGVKGACESLTIVYGFFGVVNLMTLMAFLVSIQKKRVTLS